MMMVDNDLSYSIWRQCNYIVTHGISNKSLLTLQKLKQIQINVRRKIDVFLKGMLRYYQNRFRKVQEKYKENYQTANLLKGLKSVQCSNESFKETLLNNGIESYAAMFLPYPMLVPAYVFFIRYIMFAVTHLCDISSKNAA